MRILLLSAYDASSHRRWRRGLAVDAGAAVSTRANGANATTCGTHGQRGPMCLPRQDETARVATEAHGVDHYRADLSGRVVEGDRVGVRDPILGAQDVRRVLDR